jgi:hypothetical protein
MRTRRRTAPCPLASALAPPGGAGRAPCSCAAAWAQNAIQSITSSQQAGTEVVRIELSEPLAAVPAASRCRRRRASRSTCPAWATPWAATWSRSTRATCARWRGPGRRAHAAGAQPEAGLGLPRPAAGQGAAAGARQRRARRWPRPPPPPPRAASDRRQFAPAQNTEAQALRDIDFRRGRTAPAASSSNLPSTQVGVDIRQQGQSLVVEFLRSHAARAAAPPPGRDRLRHPGAAPSPPSRAATACAWSSSPRRLGAQRLPERQPVRAGSAAGEGRPEQADAGPGLPGREAVA